MTTRTFTDDQIRAVCSRLQLAHTYAAEPVDSTEAADVIAYLYNEVGALRAKEAAVRAYAERNRADGGSVGEDIHDELVALLDEVAW